MGLPHGTIGPGVVPDTAMGAITRPTIYSWSGAGPFLSLARAHSPLASAKPTDTHEGLKSKKGEQRGRKRDKHGKVGPRWPHVAPGWAQEAVDSEAAPARDPRHEKFCLCGDEKGGCRESPGRPVL
jgi:hypothetical protein